MTRTLAILAVAAATAVAVIGPAGSASEGLLDMTAPAVSEAKPMGHRCSVDPATMTSVHCRLSRDDTAEQPDPQPGLWGSIECASTTRYRYERGGGTTAPTALGNRQHNDAYRRLEVVSGDNFSGERCELGRNESRYGENRGDQTTGTFALYRNGQHRITFLSERYPQTFSRQPGVWQTVVQMKQAQPADNGGGGPILEVQIYGDHLHLINRWHQVWSTRAPAKNRWIRYAFDVRYAPDSTNGAIKLYVDLNGDGDALDHRESSPWLHIPTLLTETDGPNGSSDGYSAGDPLPSHLRAGLYTSSAAPCPSPRGCSIDLDDVQVVAPKRPAHRHH